MRVKCTTGEELGKAIKDGANFIEIEGILGKWTVRIIATGNVAWAVCIGSLGIAVAFYLATPGATVVVTPAGGAATFAGGLAATSVAATVLGAATTTAVTIGVAAGGVGALNTLRNDYTIIEKNEEHIVLQKK